MKYLEEQHSCVKFYFKLAKSLTDTLKMFQQSYRNNSNWPNSMIWINRLFYNGQNTDQWRSPTKMAFHINNIDTVHATINKDCCSVRGTAELSMHCVLGRQAQHALHPYNLCIFLPMSRKITSLHQLRMLNSPKG